MHARAPSSLVSSPDGLCVSDFFAMPQVARCKMVVCDPSYIQPYFPERLEKRGRVIRCICILGGPVPSTSGSSSCQIIIPQKQLQRKSDVYVSVVSSTHGICLKGKYIAIVSATCETDNPEKGSLTPPSASAWTREVTKAVALQKRCCSCAEGSCAELEPALSILGEIEEKFLMVSDLLVAKDDGTASNIFVSSSFDATSHFESATEEVLTMYDLRQTRRPRRPRAVAGQTETARRPLSCFVFCVSFRVSTGGGT